MVAGGIGVLVDAGQPRDRVRDGRQAVYDGERLRGVLAGPSVDIGDAGLAGDQNAAGELAVPGEQLQSGREAALADQQGRLQRQRMSEPIVARRRPGCGRLSGLGRRRSRMAGRSSPAVSQ